jgi:hypothetical protein
LAHHWWSCIEYPGNTAIDIHLRTKKKMQGKLLALLLWAVCVSSDVASRKSISSAISALDDIDEQLNEIPARDLDLEMSTREQAASTLLGLSIGAISALLPADGTPKTNSLLLKSGLGALAGFAATGVVDNYTPSPLHEVPKRFRQSTCFGGDLTCHGTQYDLVFIFFVRNFRVNILKRNNKHRAHFIEWTSSAFYWDYSRAS